MVFGDDVGNTAAHYRRSRPLTEKLSKIQIDAISEIDREQHGYLLPEDPFSADHYSLLGVSVDVR